MPDFMELYNSFSVIADINSDAIFDNKLEYSNYLKNLGRNAELLITLEDLINYPYCSDVVISGVRLSFESALRLSAPGVAITMLSISVVIRSP